ncbi:hypothetical protein NDU88_001344 [Pleurodeles waltl]|uniref:Uncharacterized protein n=1 Tax=Pleurodeles waltl TaxID=8319 RepID=A0AAV7U9X1_PLEWA|nr:hypothetical protein NDU88_001344 [Pleurodeles waltl]
MWEGQTAEAQARKHRPTLHEEETEGAQDPCLVPVAEIKAGIAVMLPVKTLMRRSGRGECRCAPRVARRAATDISSTGRSRTTQEKRRGSAGAPPHAACL